MKLFVLAGIKSISNLFDGSFFVPYFTSIICSKKTDHVVLLVCMECCQGSSCFIEAQPCCFPKASAKVQLFSKLPNKSQEFFEKSREKINHATKECAIITTFNQISKKSLAKTPKSLLSKKTP